MLQTIFKKGYQRQEIRAVPIAREKDNNGWNSFSCPYDEIDFIRYKRKKAKKMNSEVTKKEKRL